jgi:hypothetical protein
MKITENTLVIQFRYYINIVIIHKKKKKKKKMSHMNHPLKKHWALKYTPNDREVTSKGPSELSP